MLRNLLNYFNGQQASPAGEPVPAAAHGVQPEGSFWTGEKGLLGNRNLMKFGGALRAYGEGNPDLFGAANTAAANYDKKKSMDTLAAHVKDSPALQDPATRQIVQDMISSGDPTMIKQAMEMVKQKAPEPYTLSPGGMRFGADNKQVASAPTSAAWGAPIGVKDKATGQMKYIQVDKEGNMRDLNGVEPISRGTKLSVDPETGQVMFEQGITDTNIGNLVTDPTKSPARGGQGGTFIDKTSGKTITTLSPANVAQSQGSLQAIQRVIPQLNTLLNTMPKFQSALTTLKKDVQGTSNKYLGTNFSLPSEFATGKAEIKKSAEGIVKAFKLPNTNESIHNMEMTVTPVSGESQEGYAKRIVAQVLELQGVGADIAKSITDGITVRDGKVNFSQNSQPEAQKPVSQQESPREVNMQTIGSKKPQSYYIANSPEAMNGGAGVQPPPAQNAQVPPAQGQYSKQQLDQFAQEAIAAGKSPEAVQAMMQQLLGG